MCPASPAKLDLDEASCIYGAGVLLEHLNALEKEVQGVAAGEKDIEYIHRARVASRRLRAALPLFQTCLPQKKSKAWQRAIRDVTRALGQARDLDVQLARVDAFITGAEDAHLRPGMLRLRLRLNQQRMHAQTDVTQTMQAFITSQTSKAMQEHLGGLASRKDAVYLYTPTLYQHSFQAVRERLTSFLAYRAIVHQPEKVAELHEMRIAAKWLRYTIETFAPLYANQLKPSLKAVRAVQEQLGEIHDCDVWQAFLDDFLVTEKRRMQDYFGHARPYGRLAMGVRAFAQDLKRTREQTYQEFLEDWQGWETRGLWDDLIRTLQVPFPQPEAIYPPLAQPGQGDSAN